MRNLKFLVALLVVVVFSSCSQPEEVSPPVTAGGLSTLSTDGEAEVGPDGGVIQSSDGSVTVTIPEDALSESVEIQVGTVPVEATGDRSEELPTDLALHSDVIVLGKYDDVPFEGTFTVDLNVAADDLKGNKVYVATWVEAENRWRELPVEYGITKDYATLQIAFSDMPEVTGEDANLELADLPSTDVEPALNKYTIAIIYADIGDEISRCVATGAEWMDLSLETGTPDGYCSAPIDTYWDALNDVQPSQPAAELLEPSSANSSGLSTQTYTPPNRRESFIITANVGHTLGSFNSPGDMYKLSNAAVEQRIHDNLNSLKPDLLLLQELGNYYYWNTFASEVTNNSYTYHSLSTAHKWPNTSSGTRVQIERLIKDVGRTYQYVCTRYTEADIDNSDAAQPHYIKGMAFECVVWNTNEYSYKAKLPFASYGYSIRGAAAGVELQEYNKSKPLRVLSVHTFGGSAASDRVAQLTAFRSATRTSTAKTLWAGDFNLAPDQPGYDAALLRDYVDFSSLLSYETGGEDFLKPLRTELRTTTSAWPYNYNWDHLLVSSDMTMLRNCDVLYRNEDRLDGYYSNGWQASGMDHRAIACGTAFSY